MAGITYRDRETNELKKEKIYGKFFLEALYGDTLLSKVFSFLVLPIIAHLPTFSYFYGKKQKSKKSQSKILPFIRDFNVDVNEFAEPVESFQSFNDFFMRKLAPNARPIFGEESVAVFPADGRHLIFPDLSQTKGFYIKGHRLDLRRLLQDDHYFEMYKGGSMVISRLCPTDYHRFHFPCACIPGKSKLINGPLFSVNPMALKKHLSILCENKRVLTPLETGLFGRALFIEVGATCVGSIKQTYIPNKPAEKGEEKGYFEFGGSCTILLFEKNTIQFDQDLIDCSAKYIETYAKMGTSLGRRK
ncbi:MAG: phosphatidylserine decarboxylase [Chlamydiia bacterium]|nr:phosphatidylserine decarboxylase [Chlamydiia bacterium]